MVDSGCKKIQVKKKRRRSDGGKTRERRGKDGGIDGEQTKIRQGTDGERGQKARRRRRNK